MGLKTFLGGVHPKDYKEFSKDMPIENMPLLDKYYVLLGQHIGAPAKALVKKGDQVFKGTKIGEMQGFISATVHSPTSGTVSAVTDYVAINGQKVKTVVIDADGEDKVDESIKGNPDWEKLSKEDLINIVKEAGIVGLGGAAFPTYVKLMPPSDTKVDTVILNGAECEPYLTADYRLMLEQGEKIIEGLRIIQKVLGVKTAYIGIENNKPDCIKKMAEIASKYSDIEVIALKTKYPQGDENQLITAVTSREVPKGKLPANAGVVVQNVGTSAAVYDAVVNGMPLIERVLTVTGRIVKEPKNVFFKIGTLLQDVVEFAGGLPEETEKIIVGGPMMGPAAFSMEVPLVKGSSGVLLFDKKESRKYQEYPCVSCSRCIDICPLKLYPSMMGTAVEYKDYEKAEEAGLLQCKLCGACAYVCPANRNLVQYFTYGKSELMKIKKAQKSNE